MAVLCLYAARGVILAHGFTCMGRVAHRQEFDHPANLDSDQIPDFVMRWVESGSQLGCGPSEWRNRSGWVRSERCAEFLVRKNTGAPLELNPADTISAQAPDGASWRSVDFRLMQNFVVTGAPGGTNQVSGLLGGRTDVVLGLRFRDAEGVHFGWANLALTNVDSGPFLGGTFALAVANKDFHPMTGERLKVGSKPQEPAANPGTKTASVPLALSRQFDARIRRFEWTNSPDGRAGAMCTLNWRTRFRRWRKSRKVPVELRFWLDSSRFDACGRVLHPGSHGLVRRPCC
jgi:hypothetical protein